MIKNSNYLIVYLIIRVFLFLLKKIFININYSTLENQSGKDLSFINFLLTGCKKLNL